MADAFNIIPPVVRAEGKDVPPEQIQAGFNTLARQVTVALNNVASDPTGPAGGDLSGTYPNPTVAAVHATSGTLDGVVIGGVTPAAGHFTTLDATTPLAISSGGTGATNAAAAAHALNLGTNDTPTFFGATLNGSTAHGVVIGEGNGVPLAYTAAGTTGQMLLGVTGADPAFGNNPTITGGSINSAPVGNTTPSTGAFTTLSASSGLNSTAVGNTTPSTGAFTTLSASSTVSGTGFTNRFASPGPIGNTAASTGAFTTLSSTGTFTPSSTNGIVGTTTNDNANAGSVGEYVTATSLATSVTSAVTANAASISLTAGDWDVTGVLRTTPAGSTVIQQQIEGISTTSATLGAFGTFTNDTYSPSAGAGETHPTPVVRISISSTTTVFLVCTVVFTTSTCTVDGLIRARRVR